MVHTSILAILFVSLLTSQSTTFTKKKSSLVALLKVFYGDEGPLSDYLFVDKADFVEYNDKNGPPINKTLFKKKNVTRKTPALTEKVFGRMLKDIKKGKNLEVLEHIAKLVRLTIYKTDPDLQEVKKEIEYDNLKIHKRFSKHSKKSNDILEQMIDDIFEKRLTNNDNSMDYREDRREADLNYDEDVEDVQYDTVLPFTYLDSGTCNVVGSAGSDTSSQRLCASCTYAIDYGTDVIPQYGYSTECSTTDSTCMLGDGSCYQRSLSTKFFKSDGTDSNGSEQWIIVMHSVKFGCECECIAGSTLATLFGL